MKWLIVIGVSFVIGVGTRWIVPPDPEVIYDRVEVPVEKIIEREPEVEVRFIERIRVITPDPVQIAVSTGGATADVARFCAPSTLAAVSDTLADRPPPQLLLRSISHYPGWFFQKDKVLFTGPTSYGDLIAADYAVRPGFSARTSGDSLIVRYPRFGIVREVAEPLVFVAIGIGLAKAFF